MLCRKNTQKKQCDRTSVQALRLLPYFRNSIIAGLFFLTVDRNFAQQVKKESLLHSPTISAKYFETNPNKELSTTVADPSQDGLLSPPSDSVASFIPIEASRNAAEGNVAFSKGNFEQALRAYQKTLQLAPDNLVALVNLGITQSRLGDIASAEKNLKQALSLRLETGVAWLTLGTIYMDNDRLDEALGALTQARVYDSQNARVRNYLGVVMNRMGWSDAAESELRTAVELDMTYSDAHYNLALVYMNRTPPSIELAKRHYYIAVKQGALPDANMEKYFKKPVAAY